MSIRFTIVLPSRKGSVKGRSRAEVIGFRSGVTPLLRPGETRGGSDIIGSDSIPERLPNTTAEYIDTVRRAGTTLYRMMRRSGRVMGVVEADDIVGEFAVRVLDGEQNLGKAWGAGAGAAGRLARMSASTARQYLPRETLAVLASRWLRSKCRKLDANEEPSDCSGKVIDRGGVLYEVIEPYTTDQDPNGNPVFVAKYGKAIVRAGDLVSLMYGMEAYRTLHGRFRIPQRNLEDLERLGIDRSKLGSAIRYGTADPAVIAETNETLTELRRFFTLDPDRFSNVRNWALGIAPNAAQTSRAWRAMRAARMESERENRSGFAAKHSEWKANRARLHSKIDVRCQPSTPPMPELPKPAVRDRSARQKLRDSLSINRAGELIYGPFPN